MAEVSGNARVGATGVVSRALRRWPEWMSYAVTTWSLASGLLGLWWALGGLGFPLGISERFLREGQETGLWWVGASLATIVVVGGAVLTLGLVQCWGEVFPRFAGALVGSFSFFGEGKLALGGENWAALVPELLWPLWGFALGAATLAYYYGRRGGCGSCGRA